MSSVISISLAAPAMETYHECDSVSAEVEFCQGLQTTEVGDACDLVASQVEHPQVYKVSKTLDISNLKHKREGKDTHHSTDGMLLLFQTHHLTMFPCRSRTSNLRSVCKPDILRILEYRKEQKDHVIQVLSHMIQVLSHMIQVLSHMIPVLSHMIPVLNHMIPMLSHMIPMLSCVKLHHKCLPVLAKHEHPQ